jgi:hypothetical protein
VYETVPYTGKEVRPAAALPAERQCGHVPARPGWLPPLPGPAVAARSVNRLIRRLAAADPELPATVAITLAEDNDGDPDPAVRLPATRDPATSAGAVQRLLGNPDRAVRRAMAASRHCRPTPSSPCSTTRTCASQPPPIRLFRFPRCTA